MKVAIVHDFLVKLGGAERVLRVLGDLFPHAPIYTLLYDESKVGQFFPKARVRTSPLQVWPSFLRRRYPYFFPWMPRWIESFNLEGYDLVISSSSAYAHGVLTNLHTHHISYCHSPMRYAWDWTHQYLEDKKVGRLRGFLASSLLKQVRLWDFYASDRTHQYIANSHHVRRRIAKYYRQPARVIYPPVDVERFKVTPHHENYFLIVSTLTRYKNIELAIHLFNKVRKKLVIIGDGNDRKRLERLAGPHIDFLGFKPDEVVQEYFQNCRAFVFPGEEDFGIAPVEAMACGKPVLAYEKGGVKETVIPGVTGELFEASTVASMEEGLARLLVNETRYDPQVIRTHAESFSQSHFKKNILKLIEKSFVA